MSKIGKKPIIIPDKVEINVSSGSVTVKGPKGTLTKKLPAKVSVAVSDKVLNIRPETVDRQGKMAWGLARALVQNMILGVSEGFEKVLEFQGVGYKATVKGNDLELGLGYSHPVTVHGPEGVTFKTEKNSICIQGADKELVGKVAAEIRSHRKPEPYKGSGIRYVGEHVRRKAGKKAATAA
ncbi:MAG: 50S ribosomal protein L6 [Candidatus Yanofskybacteria bacterium RIFCSPLOWO2_01_FULL_49_17]|uniref:Large ribosomal subunit protein uL6 n=1 Tax=Candidatus Yanofskybacteria bacterium RIFCSPLOWO2_01_FULL_49_17 TaxID=1802700 RepID=A0A1F8GRI0_9BACT|nr:MAG: 50S ribosomal protein L6 [Candidatus Yanofskybacteria bacterium RIFCSPLOWO2_01_FULL_49_17]